MRKYNKEQKAYIEAKKALEALESQEKEMEAEYVKSLGIVNEDGSGPTRTWTIDDDEAADKAITEFGILEEKSGLWGKILSARANLKAAEENLVQYALSIIPFKKEREVLTEAVKTNYTTRAKVIETVLQLDAATVR